MGIRRSFVTTRSFAVTSLLVSIAALAACGNSNDGEPTEAADAGTPDVIAPRPPTDAGATDTGTPTQEASTDAGTDQRAPVIANITSFTVAKAALAVGGSTTLSATFTGTSATIDQTVGAITSGATKTVSPTAGTTYTLTVTGDNGSTDTATVTVDVFDHLVEVTTTDPAGAGSLAEAMANANGANGTTGITFALPNPSTITLGATLVSTAATTVIGPGADKLSISGADQRRLVFVVGGALTVRGVTLTHGLGKGGNGGSSQGSGAGGGGAGMGGAIFVNAGALTIRDSALTESVARGGSGGSAVGSGLANGGGGGGFGGDGTNGSNSTAGMGGPGAGGAELGGTGGPAGSPATGDGAGGGGAGAGVQQNGGAGGFGGGGGGSGGFPGGGNGGFGAGAGAGTGSSPGLFGGARMSGGGGGGAGLGGAIFVRTGTVTIANTKFTNNKAIAGVGGTTAGANAANAGLAKAGAIFTLVPVTLTNVTYMGSVAADGVGAANDNADVWTP